MKILIKIEYGKIKCKCTFSIYSNWICYFKVMRILKHTHTNGDLHKFNNRYIKQKKKYKK